MLYQNRRHAGNLLAVRLGKYANAGNVIVLALPRGGVPVGFEIAAALCVPLDVFIVRKLGTPGQEELAMGAIASGGTRVINERIVRALGIPQWAIDEVVSRELGELERRELKFHSGAYAGQLSDKVVILVDDGLATGASMRAAIRAINLQNPEFLVAAVPVGDFGTCRELEHEVDELCCLATPQPFEGVGKWYTDFTQTSDDEVSALLEMARRLTHDAA